MFIDEAKVRTALENVRNDQNPTNWVIFGYPEGVQDQVDVVETGENGFLGVEERLNDDIAFYAVLSVPIVDHGASVIKYIFFAWVGPNVKPAPKARSSQHRVVIYNFAKTVLQLGGELQFFNREEFTLESIVSKLSGARKTEVEFESADIARAKGGSSEKFQFESEDLTKSSIQSLRSNAGSWIAFGYSENSEIVKILATGNGGLTNFVNLFTEEHVVYVLLALPVQELDIIHIKFIFITWVGPNVKPMHKARSSQHRVQIYNFAKGIVQLAAEIQFLTLAAVSEQALLDKIAGSRTQAALTEEELRAAAETDLKKKAAAAAKNAKPTSTTNEEFAIPLINPEQVATEISELLKPVNNGVNWISFGYDQQRNDKVVILNKGTGGLEEIEPLLDDSNVLYIIFGITVTEGDYSTLKFILINWVGSKVKPMVRARSSQHRVSLYNWSNKYLQLAGELQAHNREDVTIAKLLEKLTGSKVAGESDTSAKVATNRVGRTSVATTTTTTTSSGNANELSFVQEDAVKASLLEIAPTTAKNCWILFGHADRNVLELIGKGSNGLDSFKQLLNDDKIMYGIISVLADADSCEGDYSHLKKIFIAWVGPNVKPMEKARSSQVRVELYKYCKAAVVLHGELQILNASELTQQLLLEKVTGTRN
eukprot:TRINITY_DN800_c0_g2_i1.p1 TRINITY_DN800_c0_g2~~TRINITY_DN800_c0_g2_i1.p1  ORF type:complete len:654 (+),score=357.56 TRINITY_DN800_c0_g2_i1:152-2113(+)